MSENHQPSRDPQTLLDTVNMSMVEGLGQLADYFGYNRLVGQLYGALLFSPEPLSLDDLVELLAKSKASVSMNMRILEQLGLVREVWVRDTRKKYYEAESDLWKALINVLRSREMRDVDRALEVLNSNIKSLQATIPQMNDRQKKLAAHYQTRMEQLEDFFRLAQVVLNSLMEYGVTFDFNQILENQENTNTDD
ncbi:MAG: hypothetical protein CUN55_05545 [Phototrophicales bacterium]|nr:MAG: hypothetical protein CUN55_05545 [Phototrophicales bacterium]